MCLFSPAAGFYTLNSESIFQFPPYQEKEQICACFEEIREQNSGQRILLVLDNLSSHICAYTRERAHELGIDLIFLTVGSPHLNPIEPVWKSLKWESSPLIVEGAAEYCALLDEIFSKLTYQLNFAGAWIENHLCGFIQKLRKSLLPAEVGVVTFLGRIVSVEDGLRTNIDENSCFERLNGIIYPSAVVFAGR